jgi:hypothetical protein
MRRLLVSVLALLGGVIAVFQADPQLAAAANLAGALTVDWLLGVVAAILAGTFDHKRLVDSLRKLAPAQIPAVYGLIVAAALSALVSRSDLVNALLAAAAGAAVLYSVPIWADAEAKLQPILVDLLKRLRALNPFRPIVR